MMNRWHQISSVLRRLGVWGALALLSVVMFGYEYFAGVAGSIVKLYSLGAYSPVAVLSFNQWSRLFIAPFIHYSPVHLLFSLVLLIAGGMICDRIFGKMYTACLLIIGVLAPMVLAGLFYSMAIRSDGLIFGASYGGATLIAAVIGKALSSRRNGYPFRTVGALFMALLVLCFLSWFEFIPRSSYISVIGHVVSVIVGIVFGTARGLFGYAPIVVRRSRVRSGAY